MTRNSSSVLAICALTCLSLLAGVGCQSTPISMRAGTQTANYMGTTLSTRLPAETRVPSVIAATEQAMLARGYTIVESASTEEAGSIVGRPPRYNTLPRMVVEAARRGDGVDLSLRYEPFGDREVCTAMLDAILRRLGM